MIFFSITKTELQQQNFFLFFRFILTMLMDDYKYLFKVVLIGNASVGKTCLVRRFCQDVFPTGQAATIGVDFLIKTVEVNGEKIKVCTKKFEF